MRPLNALSATILTLLLFGTTSAMAQDLNLGGPADADINVQNFNPIAGPNGVFTVEAADSASDLQFSGGLILNFAKEPLVFRVDGSDQIIPIVEDQLAADVLLALGLFDFMEIGLDLPVYLVNNANVNGDAIEGATLGDLMLRPKFTLLSSAKAPVGIALYAMATLPTGDDAAFTSSGQFGVLPGVIVDTRIERLTLALNVGANIQDERDFGDLKVGSELTFGLGAQYELVDKAIMLGGELIGSTTFDSFLADEETPLEGLMGLKFLTGLGIQLEVGGGGGIIQGYGNPAFRVFGGARYVPRNDDFDGDGILNDVDACPRQAEDRDLFQDEDGCLDKDNDEDGRLDGDDQCPNEAEDKDGFNDEDGCPDPDNDRDGLADGDDQCPNEAEDLDGFEDKDGCPDADNDKDGILDEKDNCPNEPEGEKDGFKDEDGCPDPDNDNDGVLDADDKCPQEPETINGVEDEDGCPDEDKGKAIVNVTEDKTEIVILEQVFFNVGKATLQKRSDRILNAVAQIMKANPSIKRVEIQGHTDDQGDDAGNLTLSQERAETVRKYLVDKGVKASRLKATGYGETAPAVAIEGLRGGKLKAARSQNRRVQFKILSQE